MDGKEVLEVGAGIGAASLVASRLGARVLATDVDAGAVELLKQNGELNGADIEVAKLDWHAPSLSRQFDIVLGADVCYLRRSAAPLARLFFSALRPGGIALVVDPGRPSAEDLVEACEGEGLAARTWRVERLRTGACDMAVCRVMAFFRSGGDDDAEKSCLQALDAAVEALRSDAVPAGEPFAAHYTAAVPGSDVS
ncbi:S-adenosyl-L-methionine-dependent methyltransferase [Hyaloraphidium curvatum]|nr:S-adenosyl-L-methionine-dependent methyltransferase [Hyaloraphidium curvatum]